MWRTWTARFGTLGVATALWTGAEAQAQQLLPPTPSVDQRLERLEKANEALLKQNQALQSEVQNLKTRTEETPVATGVDKEQVQSIVSQYLQQQADKAKVAAKEKKDEWYEVGSDTKMNGSWGLGRLTFESAQKDFRAHVGGRFQFDNYFIGAPGEIRSADNGGAFTANGAFDDNSFFRRVRVEMDGQAFENIEWNFEVDLERNAVFARDIAGTLRSNGNYPATRFDEVFVGIRNLPALGNVRIGHVRPPQGLECYTSSRNLTFMERSSGFEAFCQEFDPGVWMFNYTENQRLTWAATVHRIDLDSKMGEYGKGDYAVTGRIAGLPVYRHDGRCLVHLGASYQVHSNPFNTNVDDRSYAFSAPPDFRSSYFTPAFVATGPFISDHVNQFGLEALAIWGPISVQAEYFGVNAADVGFPIAGTTAPQIGSAYFTSGYVYVSYFLTGENRRYDKRLGRLDRVVPNENFFFVKGDDGHWQRGRGAWEVAARYDFIDLSDSGIEGGYMNNYTLGLNWYFNPNLKFQWNWTMADRSVEFDSVGGGAHGNSGLVHAVGMRVQWEF